MNKKMQVIGIIILSLLMLACTIGQLVVGQAWRVKANEANLSLALARQTNEFLVQKIDNIIQRQSGQKTFGYPIDLPNDIKGHVILHYDEEADFSNYITAVLEHAHKSGIKGITDEEWNKYKEDE